MEQVFETELEVTNSFLPTNHFIIICFSSTAQKSFKNFLMYYFQSI